MRRVTLAYVVYFAAIGAGFPYLPVYYRSLGLDLGAVGAVTAVQAATQLVMAPVWGGLADAFPRTRMTLPLAAVVAAVGGAWLALVGILGGGLPVVVAGAVILFAGLAGIGPILDARTLETLGPDRDRYGQVRAWGSLSFVVVASLVGVLIDRFGDRSMFVAYVPLLVGTAVVTMTIARRGEIRSVTVVRDARAFLAAPRVAIFLTGSFLVWTSLNGTNSFYSIQVVALGGGTTLVGLAWAIGALVEVPIMFSFPRLAARFGTERLLVLGAIAIVLRAALAALARDPVMLVAIAPIEGLAFACTYVGGVTYLGRRAPAGLASTAQGLLAATTGLATIAGSVLGGAVAGAITISGLFAACAAASLVATAVVAFAVRPAPSAAPGG